VSKFIFMGLLRRVLREAAVRGDNVGRFNMTKSELEIFKSTAFWQEVKETTLQKYETCVMCDGSQDLDIHCRNLTRIRKADIEKSLTILCQSCRYKYARNVLKESKKVRPQKKKLKLCRNEKIKQAEEFLWQQMQKRFNEIKMFDKESYRTKPIQKHQPAMKKEDFIEAMKKT